MPTSLRDISRFLVGSISIRIVVLSDRRSGSAWHLSSLFPIASLIPSLGKLVASVFPSPTWLSLFGRYAGNSATGDDSAFVLKAWTRPEHRARKGDRPAGRQAAAGHSGRPPCRPPVSADAGGRSRHVSQAGGVVIAARKRSTRSPMPAALDSRLNAVRMSIRLVMCPEFAVDPYPEFFGARHLKSATCGRGLLQRMVRHWCVTIKVCHDLRTISLVRRE
jgi:hypothetical protein